MAPDAAKGTRASWFFDCDETNAQCPFEIRSPDRNEIVTIARLHFKNAHGMNDVPEKDVLGATVERPW